MVFKRLDSSMKRFLGKKKDWEPRYLDYKGVIEGRGADSTFGNILDLSVPNNMVLEFYQVLGKCLFI